MTTVNGVAGTAVTLTDGPDSTLANNGLSLSGDTVQLGGNLTKATTVTTTATNTLALAGLQSGTAADSILVANATTGVLARRSTSSILTGATTNTLSSAVNTMTNTTNGVVATAPIVNSISNTFNPATRTIVTTVNGVAGTAVTLTDGPDSTLANNGLSLSGDTVQLGGNLTKATTVTTTATNTLALAGLQSGTAADSILVANATTGVISRRSLTSVSSATEPWFNQVTNTAATANTQNIYQLGNVGIGTTLPRKRLHLQAGGNTLLTGSFGEGFLMSTNGGAGTRFWIEHTLANANEKTMVLYNQFGSTKFSTITDTGGSFLRDGIITMLHSSGNVGLSTPTPTNTLDVNSVSNPLRLRGLQSGAASDSVLTSDATGVVRMRSASSISAVSEPWFNQATNTPATSNTQNIYQMGNVGIGTTTPSVALDGIGGLRFQNSALTNQLVWSNATGGLFLKSNNSSFLMGGYSGPTYRSQINGTAYLASLVGSTQLGLTTSDATPIIFATDDWTERMRIQPTTGNVGIGFTSPANKLHVQGNALFVPLTGNNGLTGEPVSIELYGKSAGAVISGQVGGMKYSWYGSSSSIELVRGINTNGAGLAFNVSDAVLGSTMFEAMRIMYTGNTGIGTNAPTNRLDVSDIANPLRLRGLQNGAASDSILTADATGVVRKIDATQVGNVKTISTKTANYSFLATDYTILMNCTAGALTVTLPAAASNTGRIIVVSKYDETANALTISPAIRQSVSTTISSVNTQITFTLQSNGTDWVIIGRF